jgi:hypothetical protein
MNSPLRHHQIRVDVLEAFQLRCWARSILWQSGEYENLHEAVDPLWACAVASGLRNKISVDEVQRLMADAFHRVRS